MQNINISFVVILDIIIVGLLILFALLGRRRGLVKMITGVLVIILSITVSGSLAKWTSPYVSSNFVEPRITQMLLPEVQEIESSDSQSVDKNQTDSIASILLKLGLPTDSVTKAVNDFKKDAANSVEGAVTSLSHSISEKVSYGLLFVIFLILSFLIFTLLAKVINLAAKLPVINFLNKSGGLILGALWGYLIIVIVTSLLTRFNLWISSDTVNDTVVLNFIVNNTPLSLLSVWQ